MLDIDKGTSLRKKICFTIVIYPGNTCLEELQINLWVAIKENDLRIEV